LLAYVRPVLFRFGAYELDEAKGELRREGRPVAIQPKPLALLGLLLRERERVVPANEILDALWPETVVTPGSLNRAVSHARRAIGDTHRGRFITSVSKRGYRFSGEVVVIEPRARPAAAPKATAFVGREDARSALRTAWAASLEARRSAVALVTGPAGIGKTRLAEIACAEIAAGGGLVLSGRAREGEGVPAFWLWAQVLRRLLEAEGAADELRDVTRHAAELAELLQLEPPARPAEGAGRTPEQSRFLLFDGVSRVLLRAARRRPLLVWLEDLQWAGAESLRLLEHLALENVDAALLVLATVRDEVREPGDAVSRTLALLRSQDRTVEVALAPFSRAEVAALLERVLGRPAPSDLTSELSARTEGVPLFVREALRLLDERGALAQPERIAREGVQLPPRALDLIRRPLGKLSSRCAAAVAAAAVLGREFDLPAVSHVATLEREQALDAVDEAARAGVIEESAGRAGFRFTHALFQEAVLAGLAPGERARLHGRAAEHLERENAGDPSAVLAELAHHHHRALAIGDPERACAAALRAAEQAERLSAFSQAALHYEQASAAFEQVPGCDPERRLELALARTEAWRLASERSKRRQAARAAFELARALARPREMARAAIGLLDLQEWGVPDAEARAAVTAALAALGEGGGVEEARLVTRLAYLDVRDEPENAARVGRHAVALAREAGDADALQDALYTLHFAIGGPEGLAERSAIADEIDAVALRSRSADRAVIALLDVAGDSLERGDREGSRRRREQAQKLAGARPHLGMRWHLQVYDTGITLLEGRLDEVESRADAALSVGLRAEHPYARGCANAHRALLARERGDDEGLLALLSPALRAREGPTHWVKAVVARAQAARGKLREARALFEELAARGFGDIPRNLRWTATLNEIAALCADLGDRARGEALRSLLSPYAERHAVMPLAILYGGPLHLSLARLAESLARADEAAEHYAAALAACEALHADPMRARAALHAGRFWLGRERKRALALLEESARSAAALGMARLAGEARSSLERRG
jgi:DNA-binding winged helix-turn-helix (wHTH) protein